MTNGMVQNLSNLGMRQLLEYRGTCIDAAGAILADSKGTVRLLKPSDLGEADGWLNEFERATREFERRRQEGAAGVAGAMSVSAEMRYSL